MPSEALADGGSDEGLDGFSGVLFGAGFEHDFDAAVGGLFIDGSVGADDEIFHASAA